MMGVKLGLSNFSVRIGGETIVPRRIFGPKR
jgi:hypothetical protein